MPKSDAPGLGRRPAFEVLSSWCDRLCIRSASNLCVWDLALLVLAIHGHVGFCCKVGHVIEQPGLMHTTDNTTDAACPVSLHSYCIAIRNYTLSTEFMAQNDGQLSTALQLFPLFPFALLRSLYLMQHGQPALLFLVPGTLA